MCDRRYRKRINCANTNDIAVEVVLDNLPYPDRIKKRIKDEFNEVLRLLDFGVKGHDIFRRWYVDGRLLSQSHRQVIPKRVLRKFVT